MVEINFEISRKEFIRLNYFLSYRKPLMLMVTAFGFLDIVYFLFHLAGNDIGVRPDNYPIASLITGVMLAIVVPISVYFSAGRIYDANRNLHERISWNVSTDKIVISGPSFHSESGWQSVKKITLLKNWTLIQAHNRVTNFIPQRAWVSVSNYEQFLNCAKKNGVAIS